MAFGLEVAGLALALFPIIVEGLKFYAEEKGTVKDFLRYQHVIKRLVRDLGREHLTFRISCQLFLEDVVCRSDLSPDAVDEMMRNLGDRRWKEENWLQEGILDLESIQRFLETVEDMHEELSKICKWLGLNSDASLEVLDKKTRRRQWKKLILVIRQDEITQHLEAAARLNIFLARLIDQARMSAPTSRPRHKHTKHYKRIRSHAIDLYHTLNQRLPGSPSCRCASHQVNIKLEYRVASGTDATTPFHTLFTLSAHTAPRQPTNPWREMQLENWQPMETTQSKVEQISVAQTPPKWKLPFRKKDSNPPLVPKKVAFLVNDDKSLERKTKYSEIQDLCNFIIGSKTSIEWHGFITDDRSRKHRLRDVHQTQALSIDTTESNTISLAQAFFTHQTPTRDVRSKLGLKLASSVMQLHTTEWLSGTWGAENIFFLLSRDGIPKLNDPLVQQVFGSNSQAAYSNNANSIRLGASIPCLFSLGLVLIELWHWKPFAELKTDQEKAMMNAPVPEIFDIMAADRLVKAMDDAGPSYTASVQRCIFGVDAACTSLEEDKFRDEVEEKIIFPLAEHLRFFCGKETAEECF